MLLWSPPASVLFLGAIFLAPAGGAFHPQTWYHHHLQSPRRTTTTSSITALYYDRFFGGGDDSDWRQQKQRRSDRGDSNKSAASSSRRQRRDRPKRRPARRREPLDDNNDDNNLLPVHSYYLATCLPGMAEILRDELVRFGCVAVETSGRSAVNFGVTNVPTILRVLLWTRTAHKVMELLVSSSSRGEELLFTREDVYNYVRETVPVTDLLGRSPAAAADDNNKNNDCCWLTLAVSVTLNNAKYIPDDINHSHYTALTVKNALVDAARAAANGDDNDGSRPSVDTTNPDVPLVAVLRGIIPSENHHPPRYAYSRNNNSRGNSNDIRNNNSGPAAATLSSGGAHLSLYRQIHAGSLHRRGYRYGTAVHKAAMKESTAAGLLMAAGWHHQVAAAFNEHKNAVVLVDPMMGSGTFLLEGAMMAADLAPGLMRLKCGVPSSIDPPILRWNHNNGEDDDDNVSKQQLEHIWNDLLREATFRAKDGLQRLKSGSASSCIKIVGNDIHPGAVKLAEHALRQAGLSAVVELHQADCLDWQTGLLDNDDIMMKCPWTVVTNPPWDVRLTDDMHQSWESLRIFLRERCPGNTNAWILSGSPKATKHLGLRRSQSLPLQTGQQDLRWLQYVIRDKTEAANTAHYSQSRKQPTTDLIKKTSRPNNQGRDEKRVASPNRPKKKSPPSEQEVENEWLI